MQSSSLWRTVLCVVCAMCISANSLCAEPDRMAEDFVQVGLLIAEPGDVLYTILGHAALHLRCDYYNLDYVYTYESEAVTGRVGRFLLNDLKMGMLPLSLDDYLSDYRQEGRAVREYALNLPPEVESELWRVLDEKVAEGIELPYDYITRGCAVSIVHNLCEAIRATDIEEHIVYPAWGKPFERTLREIVYDNSPVGWQRFFGMTLVGGKVDDTALPKQEKLIIPRELVQTWQHSTLCGRTIISEEPTVLLPEEKRYDGDKFTPLHLALIILLLAVGSLFWSRPYIDWLVMSLQTVLGCLMLWLLLSPLPGSEWSWLIIPFNPLPALLWKWRKYWGWGYALVTVVWIVAMLLAPHRLVEYAHLLLALAAAVVVVKPLVRYKMNIDKTL